MVQHIRIRGMALLQRSRLPLLCLGRWCLRHGIYLCLLHQLQISLLVAHPFEPCIQTYAVAMRAAEIAAVLVGIRIEAQMMFSHAAVTAEGAVCLDLRPPQRSGVEDKPAPSGRFHDGNLIVLSDGQTGSPSYQAACCSTQTIGFSGRTCKGALLTHFAMMTCPVGRTLARSSTDSMLSTKVG